MQRRSGLAAALAALIGMGGQASAQVALDKNYDCEAEWAVYCGGDTPVCQKTESIVAERSFSVDLKRRTMDAALYSAVFSGPATLRISQELVTTTGVLTSQRDPKSGKIFAVITLRRKDARFSVTWRGEGDLGTVFAVGACTARTRQRHSISCPCRLRRAAVVFLRASN